MSRDRLFDEIGNIDDKIINESAKIGISKKEKETANKSNETNKKEDGEENVISFDGRADKTFRDIILVAASIIIILGIIFAIKNINNDKKIPADDIESTIAPTTKSDRKSQSNSPYITYYPINIINEYTSEISFANDLDNDGNEEKVNYRIKYTEPENSASEDNLVLEESIFKINDVDYYEFANSILNIEELVKGISVIEFDDSNLNKLIIIDSEHDDISSIVYSYDKSGLTYMFMSGKDFAQTEFDGTGKFAANYSTPYGNTDSDKFDFSYSDNKICFDNTYEENLEMMEDTIIPYKIYKGMEVKFFTSFLANNKTLSLKQEPNDTSTDISFEAREARIDKANGKGWYRITGIDGMSGWFYSENMIEYEEENMINTYIAPQDAASSEEYNEQFWYK